MRVPVYIFILMMNLSSCVHAQKSALNFDKEITTLNKLGKQIIGSETDELKYIANKNYKKSLLDLINNQTSFDFNFDSLKTISILKANNLKIYNWALPLTDGTFEYFAFLQIRKSKDEYTIAELTDKSDDIKNPETKLLTNKNWYGALYYKIINEKKIGENYYTVLGWDGNNNLTNKKIIDVINLSNNGMVKIGSPIFKSDKSTKKRVIFEYSEDVVMSLKYNQNEQRIIFDHLVPASSKLTGVYEYYGPALKIFDTYNVDKGKWVYEEDADVKLDRSIKDNMWNNPKGK